jgi:hypothetical protein
VKLLCVIHLTAQHLFEAIFAPQHETAYDSIRVIAEPLSHSCSLGKKTPNWAKKYRTVEPFGQGCLSSKMYFRPRLGSDLPESTGFSPIGRGKVANSQRRIDVNPR